MLPLYYEFKFFLKKLISRIAYGKTYNKTEISCEYELVTMQLIKIYIAKGRVNPRVDNNKIYFYWLRQDGSVIIRYLNHLTAVFRKIMNIILY